MIVLPLTPDPVSTPVAAPPKPAEQAIVKVLALGFTPAERKLIQGVAALTQRRSLRVELLEADAWPQADVVMVDGTEPRVMAWLASASVRAGTTVIQVDGATAAAGHIHLQRPIQWPSLPSLLQQARDPDSPISARQSLPAAL